MKDRGRKNKKRKNKRMKNYKRFFGRKKKEGK
jgi:hypothetical protein